MKEQSRKITSKRGSHTWELGKAIAKKQVRQNFCTQLVVEIQSRLPKSAVEGQNCVNHFKRQCGHIFGKWGNHWVQPLVRLVELKLWTASWFIFWRNTGASSAALHGSHTTAVAPCKPQTTCLRNSEHYLNLQRVMDGKIFRKELSRTAPETAAKGSICIRVSHWGLNYPIYHSTVEDFHPHFWKSSGAHTSFNWDMVSLIVVFLPHFSLDSDLDFNLGILFSNLIEAHTTQPILGTARSDQAQASRKNRVRIKTLSWCLMDLNSTVQRTWILCFVTSFQCSILDVILKSNR